MEKDAESKVYMLTDQLLGCYNIGSDLWFKVYYFKVIIQNCLHKPTMKNQYDPVKYLNSLSLEMQNLTYQAKFLK